MSTKTWRMSTVVCDSCGQPSPHTAKTGKVARELAHRLSGWRKGGRGEDCCAACFRKALRAQS